MRIRHIAATVALMAISATASARSSIPAGTWANPKNSVHVVFKSCRDAMCGTVVWASPQAIAKAEDGGTEHLVGSELFRDFVEEDRGVWSGQVFVPDVGQTVTGTITQVDARTLLGEGCIVAGFGCKTQTWKRIK